eukprot:459262-Prymnesium_polylepis.1
MSAMAWAHAHPTATIPESNTRKQYPKAAIPESFCIFPRLPRISTHAPSQHRVSVARDTAHPGPAKPSAIVCPAALHRAPAARPPPPLLLPF